MSEVPCRPFPSSLIIGLLYIEVARQAGVPELKDPNTTNDVLFKLANFTTGFGGEFCMMILPDFTKETLIPLLKEQLPDLACLNTAHITRPEHWEEWFQTQVKKVGPTINVRKVCPPK